MTRSVVVVTGTRAEYGLLRSSMRAIERHDCLDLNVVATGMHLSETFGHTVRDIEADGFEIAATPVMLVDGDTGSAMAKSLGVGILGLVDTFQELMPDVLLVLGDRGEPFAAAVAAAHLDIPIAHIHGGDATSGATVDESIRHALTKFAHLHFPATERSAERIRKLGEEDWRIEVVGAPGLDDVLTCNFAGPDQIATECNLSLDRPILVILQHPVTVDCADSRAQMEATLDGVSKFDGQLVCIYPNADAGSRAMIEVIESRAGELGMNCFKSLPRPTFLGLLDSATVLVGNSSAGIIEAPSLDLPVVDVGERQAGRERAANTISVEHDAAAIRDAVDRAMSAEFREEVVTCSNPYESGGAGQSIADWLVEIELGSDLLRKRLTY